MKHAEGFAAGEMKHGPIALVEEGTPIVVLCPPDSLFDKTGSNMIEVASRGARIVLLTGGDGARRLGEHADAVIELPTDAVEHAGWHPFSPLYYAVALQLLASHTAHAGGLDVDKPRNLAKSVTVE